MATYKNDITGQLIEVGDASLNPELVKGYSLYTPPSDTINSSMLNSGVNPDFKSPAPSTPYPIDTLTPEEQKAQDLSTQLQGLNQQLVGQSAYKTSLENQEGLGELEKTKSDLTAQLKMLINESQAIPLQLQEQFKGTGATKGGVAPIQQAALNQNAIKALSVSALLDATNGNITTALAKIDKAVAQKYDPIKEQIAVAKDNLELILNSPQYNAETKAKAQAQLDKQNQKEKEIAKQEAAEEAVKKGVVNMIQLNPGLDSLTIQQLSSAKDELELAKLAEQKGLNFFKEDTTPQVYGTSETGYYTYNPQTKQFEKTNIPVAAQKVDQLTLDEYKKQYPDLPIELVGSSEQNLIMQLKSQTPPSWFSKIIPGPLPPQILQAEWLKFAKKVLQTQAAQVQKGSGETEW